MQEALTTKRNRLEGKMGGTACTFLPSMYTYSFIMQTVEIEIHHTDINKEDSPLTESWKPLTFSLKV
jgi:hypothetical protein